MNVMATSPEKTSYDRAECAIGAVHLGYGAFHRAHQAVYIDDYMEKTGDLRWGIAAVNLRAADAANFAQSSGVEDGYVLRTTSHDGVVRHRRVRPHIAYHDWSKDAAAAAAEALVALPSVHFITMTVTESGYYIDEAGNLDCTHPVIAAEISGGGERASVYAYLASALEKRFEATGAPISILCCDNIRSNGKMLKKNLMAYLEAIGKTSLTEWVEQNAAFPCSMVDRIVPRATDTLRDEIAPLYGAACDPVHGESFIQWVLEKDFKSDFPALHETGVEIVDDVLPYEEAKIRILNGSHVGTAYIAALAGHTTFDQAMADRACRRHFDDLLDNNILPALSRELPFDKHDYRDMIAKRFSNTAIADSIERIGMDGYAKTRIFLLPTIRDCFDEGIDPVHVFESIACWFVYAGGVKAGTMKVNYIEPNWAQLEPLIGDADKFARDKALWGDLPESHAGFTPGIINAIERMRDQWQN